jgi:hypothetical protein
MEGFYLYVAVLDPAFVVLLEQHRADKGFMEGSLGRMPTTSAPGVSSVVRRSIGFVECNIVGFWRGNGIYSSTTSWLLHESGQLGPS